MTKAVTKKNIIFKNEAQIYSMLFLSLGLFTFIGGGRAMAVYLPLLSIIILALRFPFFSFSTFFENPLHKVIIAFGLWALLSCFWSVDKASSLSTTLHLLPLLLSILVLSTSLKTLPQKFVDGIGGGLVIGFSILLTLVILYILQDRFLHKFLNAYYPARFPSGYTYVTPCIAILSCLIWPVLFFLKDRNKGFFPLILYALTFLTPMAIPYHSGRFSMILGSLVFCLVYMLKEKMVTLFRWIAGLYVLFAPALTQLFLSPHLWQHLTITFKTSWLHRLYTWEFITQKIYQKPLYGWGFNSARFMATPHDVTLEGWELVPLHPHNGVLQVWLELGGIGIFLFLALIMLSLKKELFKNKEPFLASTFCASFASASIFFIVSFGVWQSWWVSTLGLLGITLSLCLQSSSASLKRA
jgi:O-antigen ligase